ncbi:hypothetical protein AB4Y45_32535 [Paraburkholderia sp. EG287A]
MSKKQFWCYVGVVGALLFMSIILVSLPPHEVRAIPQATAHQ